jgi:hypothetical protein
MLQNILVAGATRRPPAYGFKLEARETIEGPKVMGVLQDVEKKYPGVGLSLLNMFFPGGLRPDEEQYWAAKKPGFETVKKSPTI